MFERHFLRPWRRQSTIPPLPVEWLVSLFDYKFYARGQIVDLPTEDSLVVECGKGDLVGKVIMDTLIDAHGRVIVPDCIIDRLGKLGLDSMDLLRPLDKALL